MILEDASKPFDEYLDGGEIPSNEEIKSFQKLIIRESKISRNNDPRQSYDYIEPTRDNPSPNTATGGQKLNPPTPTKKFQELLKRVIAKKNETL